jgi:hypothetical protein
MSPRIVQWGQPDLPAPMLADYVPWLELTGASILAGAIACAIFEWRGRRAAAVLSFAAGGLFMALAPTLGHNKLTPVYSAREIVESTRGQIKPDVPFYTVNTFDHTLPFYLGRTVTMVVYKDELDTSISWEPDKFLPDFAAFARAWNADREAYAVFNAADWPEFQKQWPLPMQVIAVDPRRVIVKKP